MTLIIVLAVTMLAALLTEAKDVHCLAPSCFAGNSTKVLVNKLGRDTVPGENHNTDLLDKGIPSQYLRLWAAPGLDSAAYMHGNDWTGKAVSENAIHGGSDPTLAVMAVVFSSVIGLTLLTVVVTFKVVAEEHRNSLARHRKKFLE